MAMMMSDLRAALVSVGVNDALADKAATEVAAYDTRITGIETRLAVLTWMVGTLVGLVMFLLAGAFAIWSKLGDLGVQIAGLHH